MKFSIPDRHVGALKYLVALDETAFVSLHSALADERTTSRAQLEARVKEALPSEDTKAGHVVGAILSLCVLRSADETAPGPFAAEIGEAEELDFSEEERATFVDRLVRIVSIQSLTNLAKAANLLGENAQLFGEARVITDIRPVFTDDPAAKPSSALILHTLKIEHYADEEFRSAFFVLDDVDLVKLRKTIDRAIDKSESLQSLLTTAGLAALQPMREEE